jgi:hypothetical protein
MRNLPLFVALILWMFPRPAACAEEVKKPPDDGAARKEPRKGLSISARDLIGKWRCDPTWRNEGIELREGGVMTLNTAGFKKGIGGQWAFDEGREEVVYQTNTLKRVYKAVWENGKIVLCQGREVWFRGVSYNKFLASPLDRLVRDSKK